MNHTHRPVEAINISRFSTVFIPSVYIRCYRGCSQPINGVSSYVTTCLGQISPGGAARENRPLFEVSSGVVFIRDLNAITSYSKLHIYTAYTMTLYTRDWRCHPRRIRHPYMSTMPPMTTIDFNPLWHMPPAK